MSGPFFCLWYVDLVFNNHVDFSNVLPLGQMDLLHNSALQVFYLKTKCCFCAVSSVFYCEVEAEYYTFPVLQYLLTF